MTGKSHGIVCGWTFIWRIDDSIAAQNMILAGQGVYEPDLIHYDKW